MFSQLCDTGGLPESASDPPARAGNRRKGLASEAGGRREVIRERLSSRHCEELKNAYGPPDGIVPLEERAEPKGPRSLATGSRANHLKAFLREGTGPDGSSKSLDAFE
jgi:hypothetical protein